MKKIIFTLILFCLAINTQAQLLYKITGDSLSKPSYIVASHPFLNPLGIVSGISGLREAITNTDQLVEDIYKTAYASTMSNAEKLPAGKTLASLLTPAQTKLMDSFLKKYTEVGWNSPYNQRRYNGKMPLAVLADFYKLLFVANHMGEYDPTHSFNEYFEAQAKENSEPIHALTSVDDYVNVFQNTPLDSQVTALTSFLEDPNKALTKIDKSVEAFDNKDMEASANTWLGIGPKPDTKAWTEKMIKFMADKPAFFVIPSSALGGDNGVLTLLKAQGYQVDSVY